MYFIAIPVKKKMNVWDLRSWVISAFHTSHILRVYFSSSQYTIAELKQNYICLPPTTPLKISEKKHMEMQRY